MRRWLSHLLFTLAAWISEEQAAKRYPPEIWSEVVQLRRVVTKQELQIKKLVRIIRAVQQAAYRKTS